VKNLDAKEGETRTYTVVLVRKAAVKGVSFSSQVRAFKAPKENTVTGWTYMEQANAGIDKFIKEGTGGVACPYVSVSYDVTKNNFALKVSGTAKTATADNLEVKVDGKVVAEKPSVTALTAVTIPGFGPGVKAKKVTFTFKEGFISNSADIEASNSQIVTDVVVEPAFGTLADGKYTPATAKTPDKVEFKLPVYCVSKVNQANIEVKNGKTVLEGVTATYDSKTGTVTIAAIPNVVPDAKGVKLTFDIKAGFLTLNGGVEGPATTLTGTVKAAQ
jgi:hypothetical protein